MSEVRQRKAAAEPGDGAVETDHKHNANSERRGISLLDAVRVLVTLCVSSLALSYFVTNGESLLWGYRPWFTRLDQLKAAFVS